MTDVKNAPDGRGVDPVWDRDRSSWDESKPHGTSGGLFGISGSDRQLLGAVAAIALVVGLVNALSITQDIAWRSGTYDLRTPLFWEMSSVGAIILASPVLFVAMRRIYAVSSWAARIAIAALAITLFSALHIAGMVGIRKLVMLWDGGSYDFHLSLTTLLYEFRKDVVTAILIGGVLFLIDRNRKLRHTKLAAGAPIQNTIDVIWLRDGATRIRLEPHDLVWVGSAGNYVEYRLADGSTHLVRGTLAAAETELARFNLARVHRTRLANLDRVKGIELKPSGDFELTFDTGLTVQGSRRYRETITLLERRQIEARPEHL